MLDLLTAAPIEVAFGTRTYRIGALKMREFGLLQRWIRDHAERPTVAAERLVAVSPPEEHRRIRKEAVIAERDWPPAVGSEDGNRVLLGDPEGQAYFVRVMLAKYRPDITEAEVDEVLAGLSPEDFGILVAVAFGEDRTDPKALKALATAARAAGADAAAGSTGSASSPA
jgi:hypothetical protein